MSPLIETIRIENGRIYNLELHQARVDRSIQSLSNEKLKIDLTAILNNSQIPVQGLYKCRVIYSEKNRVVEITAYQISAVQKLRLVVGDTIEYKFKFEDRSLLKRLTEQKRGADDILIVKEGMITDSSYANIVFKQGSEWVTPRSFLLAGTQRQLLLETQKIKETDISTSDLHSFTSFKLINSMLLFDGPELPIGNIIY